MKFHILISAAVLLLGSFHSKCQQLIDLDSLLKTPNDKIVIDIRGTGDHWGNCLKIVIENKLAEPIAIGWTPGFVLSSRNKKVQDMIVTKGGSIRVSQNARNEGSIFAMCGEINRAAPVAANKLSLHGFATPDTRAAATTLDRLSESDASYQAQLGQAFLWSVTDNASWREINDAFIRSKKSTLDNSDLDTIIYQLTANGLFVRLNLSKALREYLASQEVSPDSRHLDKLLDRLMDILEKASSGQVSQGSEKVTVQVDTVRVTLPDLTVDVNAHDHSELETKLVELIKKYLEPRDQSAEQERTWTKAVTQLTEDILLMSKLLPKSKEQVRERDSSGLSGFFDKLFSVSFQLHWQPIALATGPIYVLIGLLIYRQIKCPCPSEEKRAEKPHIKEVIKTMLAFIKEKPMVEVEYENPGNKTAKGVLISLDYNGFVLLEVGTEANKKETMIDRGRVISVHKITGN